MSLTETIKEKIDEMVQREIIKPVTEPTAWVSSMLVVVKPDKLRICIDPRDLNKAICREHYQMPTIDEVVTRLTKAKKFTVMDAKDGFWQKRLDTESSYTRLPSTHHLGVIDGFGCHLESVLPQRSGNEPCMSLFKI